MDTPNPHSYPESSRGKASGKGDRDTHEGRRGCGLFGKVTSVTIQEENYLRGYIDAKVEDLGKSRTHHPSEEMQVAYRDKLLAKYGLKV